MTDLHSHSHFAIVEFVTSAPPPFFELMLLNFSEVKPGNQQQKS